MTEPMYAWDHDEYCDRFVAEADRFAAVLAGADLTTEVPTCPGWTLAKLVKHAGIAHAWSAANVRAGAAPGPVPARSLDLGLPDDPSGLPEWLAAGARRSAAYLKASGPDAPAWTFGPEPHARFWGRRMLHETTVHRVDAELALGFEPVVDPEVAVDCIDELLTVIPGAGTSPRDFPGGTGETLHIHTSGGPRAGEWTITLSPDGYTWTRGHAKGDAALRGDAVAVMLVLHRRRELPDGVEVFGDDSVLTRWLAATAL
ncbi:maleylpyruvate isomerase family mycothiol-dependent enzyme [Yinghuangia sp. YIM S09857]|uniref:maleylpyruvate isomerase family mycothiol-dependent enzyme n=1 Tax=Yinghuangia sp. YIM S09857 TaxID=3436929 RepID=UPI003F52F941